MEFTKQELLNIYSGLEKLWKERLKQAQRHRLIPEKHTYFSEKAKEVDLLRSRIVAELERSSHD